MKFFKHTASLSGAFFWLLISSSAHAAGDINDCNKLAKKDDKNYCFAVYSGSGTYCDKITGYERRRDCMRKVIEKQRSTR